MRCLRCQNENPGSAVFCQHCKAKLAPSLKIPSSKDSKAYKLKILKMLSENLKVFKPEYAEHFLCPVCLEAIPLKRHEEISEAHIIPRAAGGNLKTYLCKRCNNTFGTRQDKWFGEYLKTVDMGIPKLLSTDIKAGSFWIDDIKINGAWQEDKTGGLSFYVRKDRNSPATNKLIGEKFKNRPPSLKLSVSVPILKHKKLIEVGFLTAGYLMWFGALGYSWALQEHLNLIRKQILNPDKDILKGQFIVFCEQVRWKPWIGLVNIEDEIVLAMGLENSLVLFPPADRPHLYSKFEYYPPTKIGKDLRPVSFSSKPFYGPSVAVLYDDRYLVFPNAINKMDNLVMILFISGSVEGQILHPISKEKYEEMKKMDNVVRIRPEFSPLIKDWKIKERKSDKK